MEGAPKNKRPAIITPVGGTARWTPPEQFGLPHLDYLPHEYPRDLLPITRQVLREAAEQFKQGKSLVLVCSYVIERLTPFFVSFVEKRLIHPHCVPECIRELVRLTLIASNCSDWYSLLQKVEASKEWEKLDHAIAEATMPTLKEAGLVPGEAARVQREDATRSLQTHDSAIPGAMSGLANAIRAQSVEPRSKRRRSEQSQTSRGKGRPRSPTVAIRRRVIRQIAVTGVEGEQYCQQLAAAGLSTPLDWQKGEGCPQNYINAWNHPKPSERAKWRHRIADEKSKATADSRKNPSTR